MRTESLKSQVLFPIENSHAVFARQRAKGAHARFHCELLFCSDYASEEPIFFSRLPSLATCCGMCAHFQVLSHFGGNLVVVPIVYNFAGQRAHTKQAYGQVINHKKRSQMTTLQRAWTASK